MDTLEDLLSERLTATERAKFTDQDLQRLLTANCDDADVLTSATTAELQSVGLTLGQALALKRAFPGTGGPSGGTTLLRPDCSMDLCKQLLPAVADLPVPGADFKAFLEQGRLPVNDRVYAGLVQSCPALADCLSNMGPSNDTLVVSLSACLVCPPTAAGKSEEMTGVAFFGSILLKVWLLLDKFAPRGSPSLAGGVDKNTKPSSASVTITEGGTRPDFVAVVDNLLMAAGEEKKAGREVDAIAGIKRKLSGGLPPLYYQDIPYIPVYIACGSIVQLGLLCADGTLSMTGTKLDISKDVDIVYALLASVNMYRLVGALAPKASVLERRLPLLCPMERPHETVITLKPTTVVKTIYCADAFFKRFGTNFNAVKAAYAVAGTSSFMVHAKAPPDIEKAAKRQRLDGTFTNKGTVYRVEMNTVGWVRDLASLSEQDLRAVVHAALHGLAKLHMCPPGSRKKALVHRDVRLSNFLWRLDGRPFLTDLELAAYEDQEVPRGVDFADWDSSTLSNTGRYTCASDMYQVGVMMRNFNRVKQLSATGGGKLLMADLLSKQVEAEAALGYAWLGCPGSDD